VLIDAGNNILVSNIIKNISLYDTKGPSKILGTVRFQRIIVGNANTAITIAARIKYCKDAPIASKIVFIINSLLLYV